MARLSKPTALKTLAGNPGKRALNTREPQPVGLPVAAKALPTSAKKIFTRIVNTMPAGVLTAADEGLITSLAWAINQRDLAMIEMQHQDAMVEGSTGQKVMNPLLGHINKQAELIRSISARLGLDPISRQSIQTAGDTLDDGGFNIH